MLDELLEALNELVEPAAGQAGEHHAPHREPLGVETLEERLPLAAEAAAAIEAPAAVAPEPAPVEPEPPAATASFVPAPPISASPVAGEHASGASGELAVSPEALGELQQEFAVHVHESETPGGMRDGRINSPGAEPHEHSHESGEEAGDEELSEAKEPEHERTEKDQAEPEEILSAEEKYRRQAADAEGEPAPNAIAKPAAEEQAAEPTAKTNESAVAASGLAAESNLQLEIELNSALIRSEISSPPAETASREVSQSSPLVEQEMSLLSGGEAPAAASNHFSLAPDKPGETDAAAERLFQASKPPSAEEMLSEEVKAHDACFASPSGSVPVVDSPLASDQLPAEQNLAIRQDR